MRVLGMATWVLSIATATACSAVVDSSQYVGAGSGADAGTDSGPGDGGMDAGDPCRGRTCGAGEMCDPGTGECVPRCEPACASDEVCVAGSCMDCDEDGDGYFAEGARCAPLRGTERADCDDADDRTHPGATIVCGDGKINTCPDENGSRILEAIAPVEIGKRAPFRVEGTSIAAGYRWLTAVQHDAVRGTVGFMSTEGAAVANYDLSERVAEVRPLTDLVSVTAGHEIEGVAVGFAAGSTRIGVLTSASSTEEVSLYDWDGATVTHRNTAEVTDAAMPLAIGLDGTGGAVLLRGLDDLSAHAIVRVGETGVSYLPNGEISVGDGFLEPTGSFVLASAGAGGSAYMLADEFDAVRRNLGSAIIGSPGTVLLDGAGPDWVSVFPTVSGLVGMQVDCTGGFPFDLAECALRTNGAFGPTGLAQADVAVSRADDVVFAAVPAPASGSGEALTVFLLNADGTPIAGAAGTPAAVPLITEGDVGFEPDFVDVAAERRFFGDAGVIMTFVANVANGSARELWVTAIAQCTNR